MVLEDEQSTPTSFVLGELVTGARSVAVYYHKIIIVHKIKEFVYIGGIFY
jgi:hypothetical protein